MSVVTAASDTASGVYRRHRPETTALYEVVRDNLETLYGAIDNGALAVRIPKHARKELEAYLDCGLLCRGFATLRCRECDESVLVAFSCKGRGFCPSCMGRRMCATAANRPDGLVRITLKKAYADGTVAVDMDPLSLLCRLATSVPPPRFHTVRYAGVLASASAWRSRIAPKPPPEDATPATEPEPPRRAGGYRPRAELLARTFIHPINCISRR